MNDNITDKELLASAEEQLNNLVQNKIISKEMRNQSLIQLKGIADCNERLLASNKIISEQTYELKQQWLDLLNNLEQAKKYDKFVKTVISYIIVAIIFTVLPLAINSTSTTLWCITVNVCICVRLGLLALKRM